MSVRVDVVAAWSVLLTPAAEAEYRRLAQTDPDQAEEHAKAWALDPANRDEIADDIEADVLDPDPGE